MKPHISKSNDSRLYGCSCVDEDVPDVYAPIEEWWKYAAIGFGYTMEESYKNWFEGTKLEENYNG